MSGSAAQSHHLEMAADIVSAFVRNNSVPPAELASLLETVHEALCKISNGEEPEPTAAPKTPAVSIKKSIGKDFMICLEEGKKFNSQKRHLRTSSDLTPQAYREKWGLAVFFNNAATT